MFIIIYSHDLDKITVSKCKIKMKYFQVDYDWNQDLSTLVEVEVVIVGFVDAIARLLSWLYRELRLRVQRMGYHWMLAIFENI